MAKSIPLDIHCIDNRDLVLDLAGEREKLVLQSLHPVHSEDGDTPKCGLLVPDRMADDRVQQYTAVLAFQFVDYVPAEGCPLLDVCCEDMHHDLVLCLVLE